MPIRIFDVCSANALVYVHLFCLLVLMIYVQINNLCHVAKISGLLRLNHYQATDKVSCPRTQYCDSGEGRPPDKSLYWKLFFLVLITKICCVYSKEPCQRDGSFEQPDTRKTHG